MTQTHPKKHIQVLKGKYFGFPHWLIQSKVQFTVTYQIDSQYNPYEACNAFSHVMHMN